MLSVEDKIQNACFQLNHDAYVLQSKNKKHLRQFSPCEKSLVLLECLREQSHFGMAMAVASRTHCNCHNNLPESGLWDMCFDDTARKRHYGETPSNKACTGQAVRTAKEGEQSPEVDSVKLVGSPACQ